MPGTTLGTLVGGAQRRERRILSIRSNLRLPLLVLAIATLAGAATGCGRETEEGNAAGTTAGGVQLSGNVEADGSSTVAPLTQLAAERFRAQQPDVNVTVGVSGTGGGFERFCNGETDISDASRPIKEDEEAPLCQENGIEYVEFQVATDALTVVVNAENDWVDCLTVEQLQAIWEPKSKVSNWNQVDPSFPDEELTLAGPGTDSGTFDYFTDEINGEEGASRSDYQASEDDNVIVQAVSGDPGGLGYFGFSYYEENEDTLKALEVDGGEGCVAPSSETAQSGEYTPLARPLFVYVKKESLQQPEVSEFVRFYLENAAEIAEEALFVPLTDEQQQEALTSFEAEAGA
jgi:phosphate transport system substrate-binding protein